MFKSKKKRQQQKDNIVKVPESVADVKQYQLDDIPLAHDFRSSTILPQLNTTLSAEHSTLPLIDSAQYYEQLAAWRHEKNQNRYSNGLFGGKHRGRPHTKRETKETETGNDIIEQRQLYEPDSEEENYFFQDFSAGSTNIKKKSKKVNKTYPPPVKAFDLSSFAQDLHDNRLSMVQSRSSRIVMTEDDEKQLEELLRKRSESTDSLYVPLPTAIIKSQSTPSNRPPSVHSLVFNKESSEKLEIEDDDVPDLKPVNKPTDGTPINILSRNSSLRGQLLRSPSLNSIQEHSAFTTSLNASLGLVEDNRPKSLKKSSSTASIIKPPVTPQRSIRRTRSNTSIESIPRSPIQPAFETIQEENDPPKPSKRGLLGSLRQVSRSKTTSASLKGLVRNLSYSSSQRPVSTPVMSRAAMAVLEHEKKREEEKREEEEKPNVTRLISQFMSKAARQKKNTKIVNMKDKGRAKVLRRTIIYVQPDSLHDVLKPNYKEKKETEYLKDEMSLEVKKDEGELEEEQKVPDVPELPKEYTTATKIVRQASVRKRVDRQDNRWQLQSMDETELLSSDDKYLEGVELREMSDGSVVWGIVKQQGNRKSFFAPNQNNEYEHLEDEIAPPPIPKRSPRRKTDRETTDIYYSDQMSLPHLLKMMQDSHPGDEQSVDDQLDEMMRILTSQQ
ncbi:hypothetical protein BY458DRAFT_529076 [Sporodiniella umbellata]|nr:hypothetical protein BY458DRAFT_529076 [Sporodiniella umbellata]